MNRRERDGSLQQRREIGGNKEVPTHLQIGRRSPSRRPCQFQEPSRLLQAGVIMPVHLPRTRSQPSQPYPATGNGSFRRPRGMPLGKLSGCYECRMIVDPSRYLILRTTICACSECGEVFTSLENLEAHRAMRHAVSELGPDDSGRNIVEIIFKSSWLKKEGPVYKIERILKVHNSQRAITRFEDNRATVKAVQKVSTFNLTKQASMDNAAQN